MMKVQAVATEEPDIPMAHRQASETSTLSSSLDALQHTKKEEVIALAKKLGETYVSRDLTMLLQFKSESDKAKQREVKRVITTAESIAIIDEEALKQSRQKPAYRIKTDLLYVLGFLVATPGFKKVAQSPVNLLYSDLLLSYINQSFDDPLFRMRVYRVLDHLANQVEIEHRLRWNRISKDMDIVTKHHYRNKMDLMLFRIHGRLLTACEMDDIGGIRIQLQILGDYIRECRTRVMVVHVVEVCFQTLLRIKVFIMKSVLDATHVDLCKLYSSLLKVFDALASLNTFAPLNDMLLTVLVQKPESWSFLEAYATKVLQDRDFAEKVLKLDKGNASSTSPRLSHSSSPLPPRPPDDIFSSVFLGPLILEDLRLQVVRHFSACCNLIKNQFLTEENLDAGGGQGELKLELLNRFHFLTYPVSPPLLLKHYHFLFFSLLTSLLFSKNTGILHRLLASDTTSFGVQSEILTLIHKLLTIVDPQSPMISDIYVDAYVSFHYLHFLVLLPLLFLLHSLSTTSHFFLFFFLATVSQSRHRQYEPHSLSKASPHPRQLCLSKERKH